MRQTQENLGKRLVFGIVLVLSTLCIMNCGTSRSSGKVPARFSLEDGFPQAGFEQLAGVKTLRLEEISDFGAANKVKLTLLKDAERILGIAGLRIVKSNEDVLMKITYTGEARLLNYQKIGETKQESHYGGIKATGEIRLTKAGTIVNQPVLFAEQSDDRFFLGRRPSPNDAPFDLIRTNLNSNSFSLRLLQIVYYLCGREGVISIAQNQKELHLRNAAIYTLRYPILDGVPPLLSIYEKECLKSGARKLVLNQVERVCDYLADALGDIGDRRATQHLVDAFRLGPMDAHVIAALLSLKDDNSVAPIVEILEEKILKNRTLKQPDPIEFLGKLGSYKSVDLLIRILEAENLQPRLKASSAEALEMITGEKFGNQSEKWYRWWAQEKSSKLR